jgi:uncharacterized protein
VRAVLNGFSNTLEPWIKADPRRFLPVPMILSDTAHPELDISTLQQQLERGQAVALGEVLTQYAGLRPDDPVLESFWRLAEQRDVPVMVHMGMSFPGTAYSGYPAFRLSLGNPMLLEEVLVRHPRLRVWVAHGGCPGRKRCSRSCSNIRSCTSTYPPSPGLAVESIDSAEFLTAEQKRDIFYANAVRFLRLQEPLQ